MTLSSEELKSLPTHRLLGPWVRCPCGGQHCRRVWPYAIGTFAEGTGFEPEEVVKLVAAMKDGIDMADECADSCQYAKDVDMPQYACAKVCQYTALQQAQADVINEGIVVMTELLSDKKAAEARAAKLQKRVEELESNANPAPLTDDHFRFNPPPHPREEKK